MDDKKLEKEELGGEEIIEDGAAENSEENKEWKFDGEAPTLDSELELDDEHKVDIPEETATVIAEIGNSHGVKKGVNKKALKYSLISIAAVALVAVITAVCVWAFAFPNSDERMTPANTAMTIGKTKVSIGMYNFYYAGTVNNYLENAQYGNNNIDPTVDFAEQFTTDKDGNEISWLEVFKKDTIAQIQYNVAYYEKAVEEGITLTEQQKAQIDDYVKGIEQAASNENMSVNAFIEENYGEYCGLATFKKILEQSTLGNTYKLRVYADNKYDEAELKKYVDDNVKQYSLGVFAGLEIMGGGTDEKSIAELKARTENYKNQVKDVKSLKALIPDACAELIDAYINSYGYFESVKDAVEGLQNTAEMKMPYPQLKEQFGDEIADWLVSDDGIGETRTFVNEKYGMAYVFYKTGKPAFSDTEYFSVRHLLVLPKSADEAESDAEAAEDPTEKTYTEEEWNTALEKANEILEEYKSGEQTELAFALLAEQKSDDVESTTSGTRGLFGGAMEGVGLGTMVPEFEKWATDKSHKYGDVEIIKSQFGYHIMYYIYSGPEYLFTALYDMKAEKIAKIETEFVQNYAVEEKGAMKKVKIAEPIVPEATENNTGNN